MPCLSWRGRTAQRRDGQLYDLLSMWHQCVALFHGKRIPHVFQVFSSLFYALRKIRNLLIPVIGWNLLILIPVVIVRHKFVNPITLFLKSLFQQGYLWHFWFLGSLILIYLVMPLLYWLLHDHTLALSLLCMLLALCSICLCLLSMHRGYSIHSMFPRRSASGHGCSFSSWAAFVQSRQRKIPCFCPSICLCGFTGSWCCSLPSSIISASKRQVFI